MILDKIRPKQYKGSCFSLYVNEGKHSNNNDTPYYPVGRVMVQNDTKMQCRMGTLIKPNLIMTTASVFYHDTQVTDPKNIQFLMREPNDQIKCFKISKIHFPERYKNQGTMDYDFAILQLKGESQNGYMGTIFEDDRFKEESIKIICIEKNLELIEELKLMLLNNVEVNQEYFQNLPYIPQNYYGAPIIVERQGQSFIIGIQNQKQKGLRLRPRIWLYINDWIKRVIKKIKSTRREITDQVLNEYVSEQMQQNLIYMSLSYNYITKLGMECLSKIRWQFLNHLNLYDNHIGDAGMQFMKRSQFPFLSHLDLGSNNITDDGMSVFMENNWPYLAVFWLGSREQQTYWKIKCSFLETFQALITISNQQSNITCWSQAFSSSSMELGEVYFSGWKCESSFFISPIRFSIKESNHEWDIPKQKWRANKCVMQMMVPNFDNYLIGLIEVIKEIFWSKSKAIQPLITISVQKNVYQIQYTD